MRRAILFSFVAVAFGGLFAGQARAADYQVCNRTFEVLDVAYALTVLTVDPVFGSGSSSPVESRGWFPIQPNDCRTFTFHQNRHSAFFFAKGSLGNTYVGNGGSFCIGTGGAPFHYGNSTVNNSGRCAAQGGVLLNFLSARPGTFTFSDDKTYVRYCNQTPGPVLHSTATFEDNTWNSRGWGRLDSGHCVVQSKGRYSGDLYIGGFWVDNGEQRWWNGPAEFCVHTANAFDYPFANSMSCDGAGQRRAGFFEMRVGPGVHTFNFRP